MSKNEQLAMIAMVLTLCYCCNFGTIISSNAQLGLLARDDGGGNCGIPKGP